MVSIRAVISSGGASKRRVRIALAKGNSVVVPITASTAAATNTRRHCFHFTKHAKIADPATPNATHPARAKVAVSSGRPTNNTAPDAIFALVELHGLNTRARGIGSVIAKNSPRACESKVV